MTDRGKLLLVEDEHVLRGLVSQFLQTEGFRVVEAGDGPQGVARFDESGPFDLALIDLNLPGFSGVEVCRRIKRRYAEQRILICSAAIIDEYEVDLLQLGIDHFLTKPYHPEVLIDHIGRELRAANPVSRPCAARAPHGEPCRPA